MTGCRGIQLNGQPQLVAVAELFTRHHRSQTLCDYFGQKRWHCIPDLLVAGREISNELEVVRERLNACPLPGRKGAVLGRVRVGTGSDVSELSDDGVARTLPVWPRE